MEKILERTFVSIGKIPVSVVLDSKVVEAFGGDTRFILPNSRIPQSPPSYDNSSAAT